MVKVLFVPIVFQGYEYSIVNLETILKEMMLAEVIYGIGKEGQLRTIKFREEDRSSLKWLTIYEMFSIEEMLSHSSELVRHFGKVRLVLEEGQRFYDKKAKSA